MKPKLIECDYSFYNKTTVFGHTFNVYQNKLITINRKMLFIMMNKNEVVNIIY